ncbi:MAG: hypothetical protein GF390_03160 [Candidatus Pacebacteria bacterium]|nr:hypothetical protein [Candidatus Paceibacterota bacterium]
MVVLVVATFFLSFFVFRYQARTLIARNQFLEQQHLENLKTLNQIEQQKQLTKPQEKSGEKILTCREDNLFHSVYFNPDDYGVDVVTIDLDTKETVSETSNNPYYKLIQKISGMDLDKLMLRTVGKQQYLVYEITYGFSAYQIGIASINQDGSDFQIKSVLMTPTTAKVAAYTGRRYYDYFPQTGQILLSEGMGDGCGGHSFVKLLSENGEFEELQEAGSGCFIGDEAQLLPRFLGYVQNKLYFAELEVADNEGGSLDWQTARVTKVYSLDPITRSKTYLAVDFQDRDLDAWYINDDQDVPNSAEVMFYDQKTKQKYGLDVTTLEFLNRGKLE